MFLLFVFLLLLGGDLVQQGPVLLRQRTRVEPADIIFTSHQLSYSPELSLPEPGQLQLVEKHQLLPAHWRFLDQLPQAGVILAGAGVDDAGQSWQEAGQTVLHLLGWRRETSVKEILSQLDVTCQFLERMLQVLARHQVGGSGHFAHHDLLRLHQIERTFLDDGWLLAQSYGDLERVGHVAVSHHGGPGARGQVGRSAGVWGAGGMGRPLG